MFLYTFKVDELGIIFCLREGFIVVLSYITAGGRVVGWSMVIARVLYAGLAQSGELSWTNDGSDGIRAKHYLPGLRI